MIRFFSARVCSQQTAFCLEYAYAQVFTFIAPEATVSARSYTISNFDHLQSDRLLSVTRVSLRAGTICSMSAVGRLTRCVYMLMQKLVLLLTLLPKPFGDLQLTSQLT